MIIKKLIIIFFLHKVNAKNKRREVAVSNGPDKSADEGQKSCNYAEDADNKVEGVHVLFVCFLCFLIVFLIFQ